ncbi:MAG: hypothetical protein M1130_12415 [Actinobacteria bacterium]|nr:hypothetical protein [Actinomycetota bacterium]
MHELYHIIEHLPSMQRIVGVNMMDEQFEGEADGFAGGVAEVIKKDNDRFKR